jgi:hypothetical protein
MPFEIVCDDCGFVLYRGSEMRSPKDVMRTFKGRCGNCAEKMSIDNYKVEVAMANKHRPTVIGIASSYFVA